MAATQHPTTLIPIGISACLLGEQVRYNGGHKHSEFCTQVLGRFFSFTSFCPEVAIGMGVPRETIRLVGDLEHVRAQGRLSAELDVTAPLTEYADSIRLQVDLLRGYIFMKDSPSCGLFSAKVYSAKGAPLGKRAGLFAGRLRTHFPLLPMEESGRLNDPALRENFVARVYVYERWMRQLQSGITPHKLVKFHSQHKYFAMSFSQKLYRELGALVATAGSGDIKNLTQDYITRLMAGTQKPPTHKGHVNVLYHMVGYLRELVPGGIRQDLTRTIEEYRLRQVPLAVPMKLMQHYLDNYAGDYIRQQIYLNPYPYELGLRNQI
jgi:uncharacterized protein YbgA (DUF1722 family)/uncharacterized protein YbbK (DUF523 family)